jgi:molybdopterin-binding protein
LVQEYFAFPDKFHFFDLIFAERTALPNTRDCKIIILFGQKPDKPVSVKPTTLKLGCTPRRNALRGAVQAIEYQGSWVKVTLGTPETEKVVANLTERDFFGTPFTVGDSVVATWAAADVHCVHVA